MLFDIEADRYAVDGTFHYLLGWVEADAAGEPVYQGLWSLNRREEQANFERFVDAVVERRKGYPDMHVYHFAPFEKTGLGEMAGRYASREDAVDDLFRNEVLIDLMPVVKQGLRAWINRDGEERSLTQGNVLVVAPYNSQVQLISQRLTAAGYPQVRVGTVDKFQGQEAPVVLYSMATSNPEDAPRGFDFLFSLNRLNVATSRSQAVVILVASPRLLEAQCKTPKQMRLVNAFCGAVGEAERGGGRR